MLLSPLQPHQSHQHLGDQQHGFRRLHHSLSISNHRIPGSILIENGEGSENRAGGHLCVGGFGEVAAAAKEELESQCPGVVSCAAKDAIVLGGGPFYQVETGRRDGRVSNVSLAADMPDVDDSIQTLITKFKNKGLSEQELVILNGAHTIGRTACFFMMKRLYNFTGRGDSDPAINPKFLPTLKNSCPPDVDVGVRLHLDAITNNKFDDQIFRNIQQGFAVISSDARLYDNEISKKQVDYYAHSSISRSTFAKDFANAMVRMGRIGVKTGLDGEIRRVCNSVN